MILGGWVLFLTLTMKYDYKSSGLIMELSHTPGLAPLMSVG